MFYFLNPPSGGATYPYTLTDLRLANPSVDFPVDITDAQAAEYHCFPVQPTELPKAPLGKKAVRILPEYVDGLWLERWELVNLSSEETDAQWVRVRTERNGKLFDCDWTQLPDAPLTNTQTAEWATYRQDLRDITDQADPFNITWPEKPE
jgi:hypothetical protein